MLSNRDRRFVLDFCGPAGHWPARLRPGAIIHVDKGRIVGRAAVLTTAHRNGGTKIAVLTGDRSSVNLTARDFSEPPQVLGRIDLPVPFAPTRPTLWPVGMRALAASNRGRPSMA